MRVIELIQEAALDVKDIHDLARYVADYIRKAKPQDHFNSGDIRDSGMTLPNVQTPMMRSMFKDIQFVDTALTPPNLAQFRSGSNRIEIDVGRIRAKRYNLENLIAHELQHAWDWYRSKGKAWDPGLDVRKITYGDYLRLPDEINARFTQVLHDISRFDPDQGELTKAIKAAFDRYAVFRDLYSAGPQGQKRYNRLLSRAYKFYSEIIKLRASQPKTWVGKIGRMVTRFAQGF